MCKWCEPTSMGIGNEKGFEPGGALITLHLILGVLASSRVPGTTIVQSMDLLIALCEAPPTLVSGFQSPVERECLKFLLKAQMPLIVCPARSAVGMRIPAEWKAAIAANRLTIRSAIDEEFESQQHTVRLDSAPRRPTTALAEHRNRFVAAISDAVLILHASPGGKLDRLATDLLTEGRKPVWTLDDPANHHLIAAGARPVSSDTVSKIWQAD